MKQISGLSVVAAIVCLLCAPASARAKKAKGLSAAQKQVWVSTSGVVAPGTDISADTASASLPVPNASCPDTLLTPGATALVAEGAAAAPSGTTSDWELTVQGNIVFANRYNTTVDVEEYIGVAPAGCADFASCTAGMTAIPIVNEDLSGTGQVAIPFVADYSNLTPSDTAVYFVTATMGAAVGQGPNPHINCAQAAFIPLAHSLP